MAKNRIQFQSGLSMPEFLREYGTEAQCEQAHDVVRWPKGFRCPRCDGAAHYVIRDGCYHAFDFQKYAARYLAAFSFRFNRCFDLRTLHQRLLIADVCT